MTTETPPIPRYIEIERLVAEIDASLPEDDPIMPEERLAPRVSPAITRSVFRNMAVDSFRALLHLTNMTPSSRVFDVGSGLGRTAMPLTRYLTEGSYTGVDVMADLIEDSRDRISVRFPQFQFQHVDVYSGMYNDAADAQPKDLRFDFPDGHFDTIFLFSVFSHMFPDDVLTYLKEFRRLLRTGGIVLATFFLLTPRAEATIKAGKTKFTFSHPYDRVRVNNKKMPEGAVAYPMPVFQELVSNSGLEQLYISHGSWAGFPRALTGQDAVVLRKD
ncbi:MAG: class I SAM-dependent methyltransferase [Sedimenticolaceae bacterium]